MPKDWVEAYAWYNLAGVKLELARQARVFFESKLSNQQITAGQKRSKDLQRSIETSDAIRFAGQ